MISFNLPMEPVKKPASINLYLLQGEPLTLVDTGFSTDAAWEALNNGLEDHGFQITDIEQVILTHAHPDHYGLAARISRETEAELLGHVNAVSGYLHNALDIQPGNRFLFETLSKSGAPKEPLERRLAPKKAAVPLSEPVKTTTMVSDGYQVTRGEEAWQVIDLPGHAPGIIGLYRPDTNEIITSDTLLSDINSRPVLYMPPKRNENRYPYMADYMQTLEKLANMNLAAAWPAHGPPIYQVREMCLEWIQEHRQQVSMFAETLKDGEKTAYQIWKALFPRVLPFDPVTGLVEIITYLDLFIVQGYVEKFEKGELEYYRLC